ncbi:MAG: tyrosine-type recombinase/integrase [Bryobacteraceae bacterium]
MFKRTRYQFGSIDRKSRKKGADVWVLRYRDELDGKSKLRSRIIGTVDDYPTKATALKAAEALRMVINPDRISEQPVSFSALIDRFLIEELPERHSTRIGYQYNLKNHIRPKWGDYRIDQIRAFAVEQWLKSLNLAPKTKVHLRNLMRLLFNAAMRWELIELGENPMRLVRVRNATKRKEEPRILTIPEFHNLLSKVEKEPFRTMILVAMTLGLRASELAALKWADIDFGTLQLTIERAIVAGRVGEVKTKYSKAKIPLDPGLAGILLNWKQESSFNKPSDWIFANPMLGGELPYYPWNVQQRYIRCAAQNAGLGGKIGWHTFRRTYSCLLRQHEVDVKVPQELLRHADIRTTLNIYTQALGDDLRKANSKVVTMVLGPTLREQSSSVPLCSPGEIAS